jgi:WD40 repeat protein
MLTDMTQTMKKIAVLSLFLMAQSALFAQTGIPRIVINSMGHSAKINNLMYTPDGQQIISVSEDKTIRMWNATSGEMLKKFESQIGDGWEGIFYASDLSTDGKLLAVAGYPVSTEKENYIIVIDVVKGTQVATATVGSPDVINAVGFVFDGKYLVSGGDDGTLKIYSVGTGSTLTLTSTITVGAPVKYFTINQFTKDIAVAAEGKTEILVYSLAGLEKGSVKSIPKVLKRHRGEINKLAYSADGSYLASSSFETTEFFVWKGDGTFVKDITTSADINAIAFSSDGKVLVGLDVRGKGASYGIPQGNKFTDFAAHDNTVFSATISPSETGNYVVASAGGTNNEIYLWNPINGRTIKKIKGKGSVIGDLAFGNGLELFISRALGDKPDFKTSFDLLNFNINRNPHKASIAKPINAGITQTSPFDLDLGKGKTIINDPNNDGRILTFKVMPNGNIVVGSDYSLRMYDKMGVLLKDFIGHSGGVRGVAFTSDGAYLASGGEDQTIILWKLAETGAARSLRDELPEFGEFFTSLPFDSLTYEPTKKAWKSVIDQLKAGGDKKVYKGIEEVYKNLGEAALPFATLFVTEDYEWVCWTPKGYFTCTSSGSQYFGWHVNRGINKLADYYAAEQYFEILFRPKQMQKSMAQAKRVEEILVEEGERLFDLGKLHTPSAGFFEVRNLINRNDVQYKEGKFLSSKQQLQLDIEVFDGGGGVREVNIFQNDKLIVTDKEFKTRQGERVERSYKVDLVNETNEFKIIVKNYQKMESRPEHLKLEYVGQVITTSTLHIMAVGINTYKNGAYSLNYAQPDAKSFVDQVTVGYEKIFKDVNKVEIYNEQATKENIIGGFNSIIAKAKPEDVFIFFYAGHGSLDEEHKDADGDSPFYFVPTDVTKIYGDPDQLQRKGLSANELRTYLTQIRSTKQVVLMDACHSGGALKSMNVRAAASDEKAIFQLARSSGVVTIASSGSKQFATEFDVLKHGVFTYVLLEALNGKADGNADGKVTVNEIKIYMEERVPELTKQYGGTAQYPTGYTTGSDFPLTILNK